MLELFSTAAQRSYALAELRLRLGIPKSSLLLILRTLRARGFVELDEAGRYRPGRKAVETCRQIWLHYAGTENLREAAREFLLELEAQTGETVLLAAPTEGDRRLVYVDYVESRQVIRYKPDVREPRPLHCTAAGKAYMAFVDAVSRERFFRSSPFLMLTPRTITDCSALRAALAEVATTGLATSIDEYAVGVSGVAAPVFDRRRKPVGACTVVGPTDRILANRKRIETAVRSTAARISQALGFVLSSDSDQPAS